MTSVYTPNISESLQFLNYTTTTFTTSHETFFSFHECLALIVEYSRVYTFQGLWLFMIGFMSFICYLYISSPTLVLSSTILKKALLVKKMSLLIAFYSFLGFFIYVLYQWWVFG
ncbi:MAG: hypothetical protein R3321_13565 [Nitrososphaeraceae archaeon]|nr:hypothetical protein [Nitrososphaeraceae archaeon]